MKVRKCDGSAELLSPQEFKGQVSYVNSFPDLQMFHESAKSSEQPGKDFEQGSEYSIGPLDGIGIDLRQL